MYACVYLERKHRRHFVVVLCGFDWLLLLLFWLETKYYLLFVFVAVSRRHNNTTVLGEIFSNFFFLRDIEKAQRASEFDNERSR